MKRLWYYYLYLLVAWGSFRYFVRLPEVVEELWFKPLLWLVPLFWWNLALPIKIEMFGKKWLSSLFIGLGLGAFYFLLINNGWPQELNWNLELMGVAAATAVTEEMVFSGFVAGYLEKIQRGRWTNWLIIGLMVMIIRLPILLFVNKLGSIDLVGILLFAGASGLLNAWIRVKTGNLAGSILARMAINLAVLS